LVGDLKKQWTVEVPAPDGDMSFDEQWTVEITAGKYMKTAVKNIVAVTPKVFCCACVHVVTSLMRVCECVSDRSGWA
jgi:hypothetical protein